MKKMTILLLVATIMVLIIGCTTRPGNGGGKSEDEEIIKGEVISGVIIPSESSLDEEIEELSSSEFVVEGVVGEGDTFETSETTPIYEGSLTTKIGPFYRVQVVATTSHDGADLTADKVLGLVPTEPVYVEFIDGYWKVRVGDCATKLDADLLKDKLKSLGYDDAWVVAP